MISKSPVYGKTTPVNAATQSFAAAKVKSKKAKVVAAPVAATPAAPAFDINADPYFQQLLGTNQQTAQAEQTAGQNTLNRLHTQIYGASGQLAQADQAAQVDQRRLADEMAYRGILNSGLYAGTERGAGTQMAKGQQVQRQGIQEQYTSQTNPNDLLDQGLKINPDGSVSPIAPGENVPYVDPTTGETKMVKYDWGTHTSAGRNARQNATNQWLASGPLQQKLGV